MNEYNAAVETDIASTKRVLSANIKRYRKGRRISQQLLADNCGLHRTYISDLENAKCNPTLSVLLTIADSLGVSLKDLLELS